MAKLAENYPNIEFVQQVAAQIPWGHNVVLLDKFDNNACREWYARETLKPIGVSEYQITGNLPEGLAEQLPSVEDIQKRIFFGRFFPYYA